MESVLFKFDIEDSINLIDERTLDILRDYQFYKNAPHIINNSVWKEAVIILNQYQPRLF